MTNARDKKEHCKKSANQQKGKKAQRIVFLSVVSTILAGIVVGAPLIFIFSGDQGPATTEASWFTRYYHSYSEMESSYEKLYSDYCKSTGKGEETIPEFFRLNYEECLSAKTGTMTHYISGISNSSQKKENERILTPYEAAIWPQNLRCTWTRDECKPVHLRQLFQKEKRHINAIPRME